MKWLKRGFLAIAALLVVAIVTLLALGGWSGKGRLESEIEIAQPPAVVFRWVTNGDHCKKWVSWLVGVEEQTPGVTGVGRRYVFVMDDPNMGELVRVQNEIIAYEPDRLATARIAMAQGFEGVASYELSPTTTGTRLKSRLDFALEHWFARLVSPIVAWQAQEKMEMDLAALKRLAEAE